MPQAVSERFSRKVTVVSFVLAIFVMYIHAKNLVFYDFGDITGTPIYYLNQIFSEILGRVGVPFFFIMSGYWMFRFDIRHNAKDVMTRKLKKKSYSLIVPYLIWNTLGFLFFFTITHIPFLQATVNGGVVVRLTFENVFKGIFLQKYYYSFWFMKDLIVITAFSPIILLLLRNRWLSYAAAAGLAVLSLLDINLYVCNAASLLLFISGGILSVYHRDFWEQPNRNKCETAVWCLLFVIFAAVKWLNVPYSATVFSLVSPILFWKAVDFLNIFKVFDRKPCWFCTQSFFIYAAHIIPVDAVNGIFSRINNTMAWASVTYMLNPLIVLFLIYIAARVMNKICPQIYRVLCGSRV